MTLGESSRAWARLLKLRCRGPTPFTRYAGQILKAMDPFDRKIDAKAGIFFTRYMLPSSRTPCTPIPVDVSLPIFSLLRFELFNVPLKKTRANRNPGTVVAIAADLPTEKKRIQTGYVAVDTGGRPRSNCHAALFQISFRFFFSWCSRKYACSCSYPMCSYSCSSLRPFI